MASGKGEGRLTDRFQLQRIRQDRAVDASKASASARTITPLTAANAVRQPHESAVLRDALTGDRHHPRHGDRCR
jgi:hypothetical protein